MRLQKYIAQAGVASRRKAEEIIKQGRVKVNGKVVNQMGVTVNPVRDNVTIDDRKLKIVKKKVYIALNKPKGYVTTVADEHGRKTVMDLLTDVEERVYPVGRLDYPTSGLLLLTNDGELTNKLTHPKHHVDKTYVCKVKGVMNEEHLKKFRNGVDIGGYTTAPAEIFVLGQDEKYTLLKLRIWEGKNRQIRRMMEAIGFEVLSLKRVSVGKIDIGRLKRGAYRHLDEREVNYLKGLSERRDG